MLAIATLFAALALTAAGSPASAAKRDIIPPVRPAYFRSSQNNDLVFAPQAVVGGADAVALQPGGAHTALSVDAGTGVPGRIVFQSVCLSSKGVVPGGAAQTLHFDECSHDPSQTWVVNADPPTVSNADGNCVTLGKAALGAPVTLAPCTAELQHLQLWNAEIASGTRRSRLERVRQ